MSDKLPTPSPPSEVVDTDRDRALKVIQNAVGEGRLTLDQFDERAEMVEQATTLQALAATTSDLVTTATPATAIATQTQGAGNQRRYTAVFGSVRNSGTGSATETVPSQLTVTAVFGSVALDFARATFGPGVTEIHCRSVFGSVELTLPPGVRLEVAGRGFFGAFERRGAASNGYEGGQTGAIPIVRVSGTAVFGAVEATATVGDDINRDLKLIGDER